VSPPRPEAWRPPKGRVLVLAPHADDEAIGCGGCLLLHRRQGDPVKVVFLTDGAAGDPLGRWRGRDYRALRRTEARRAARVLGVRSLEFWDYPDGSLGDSAQALRRRLRELLKDERPDVVYRTPADDPHPDHRALAECFKAAAARVRGGWLDCQYEVWSLRKPSAVADISSVFSRKLQALRQYRSQLRYCDYLRRVSRIDSCRGLFLPDAGYAEAFRIVSQPGASSARRGTGAG